MACVEHDKLSEPADGTRLWRYMDFGKFMQFIETQSYGLLGETRSNVSVAFKALPSQDGHIVADTWSNDALIAFSPKLPSWPVVRANDLVLNACFF